MKIKMQNQQKLQDAQEVLTRLDQDLQGLVKLLKESQRQPSTPRPAPQEPGPPEAAGDHQEEDHPLDRGSVPLSIPETAHLEKTEAEPPRRPEPNPEKLPPRSWGQKFFNVSILGLLAASLVGLAFLLTQTQMRSGKIETGTLIIRGQDGAPRAWLGERDGQVSLSLLDKAGRSRVQVSLDASGNPSLCLLDELQQKRTELKLGPQGEPILRQVKEPALPARREGKAPAPSDSRTAAPVAALPETPATLAAKPESPDAHKTAVSPTAAPADQGPGPASALPSGAGETKAPAADEQVKYVGSRTSNKYHYPDCKWAKTIMPQKLVTFSSVKEAREENYIPCPVCQPPRED